LFCLVSLVMELRALNLSAGATPPEHRVSHFCWGWLQTVILLLPPSK
jgi:hypothetical protein